MPRHQNLLVTQPIDKGPPLSNLTPSLTGHCQPLSSPSFPPTSFTATLYTPGTRSPAETRTLTAANTRTCQAQGFSTSALSDLLGQKILCCRIFFFFLSLSQGYCRMFSNIPGLTHKTIVAPPPHHPPVTLKMSPDMALDEKLCFSWILVPPAHPHRRGSPETWSGPPSFSLHMKE